MQLRKTWMFAVLSAMSMVMMACPGGGRTSAELVCATDTDCLTGEICHASAKVCVQSCSIGADCPESAKTCAAGTGTEKRSFCNCQTDALCQRDDRVDDAAGLTCNTTTKACSPSGTTPSGCTASSDCASGQICESGTCKAPTTGASCTGTGQSTCTYGEYCSSSKCEAVPAPTCTNFNGRAEKNFTPATGTGNIIYSVTKEIFGTACGTDTGSQTVKARVSFYSKSGNLPEFKEGLSGFFYVRTSGTDLDAVPLSNGYQRSSDGKSASLSVNLCTDASFSQIVLGFSFTGGNGACATFTK